MRGNLVAPQRLAAMSFAFALLLAAGCGKPSGTVSGKVTLDDKPMTGGGKIVFMSVEGGGTAKGAEGPIDDNGAFSVSKVPVGQVMIGVIANKPPAMPPMMGGPGRPGGGGPPGGKIGGVPEGLPPEAGNAASGTKVDASKFTKIPDIYGTPEKSGLTLEVKAGSQEYDVPLKSNKK